jgi:hypothetical protein
MGISGPVLDRDECNIAAFNVPGNGQVAVAKSIATVLIVK